MIGLMVVIGSAGYDDWIDGGDDVVSAGADDVVGAGADDAD